MMLQSPSPHQEMLRDSVARLLDSRYDFAARRQALDSDLGWDRKLWSDYAELGLLGLAIPEDLGGFAGSPDDIRVVLEEMGSRLTADPFVSTAIVCAPILASLPATGQTEAVVSGKLLAALALRDGEDRRIALDRRGTTAAQYQDRWRLSGRKVMVHDGDSAEVLLVAAAIAGEEDIGLFEVNAAGNGVSRQTVVLRDGSRAADIDFDAAEAKLLVEPDLAPKLVDSAIDWGRMSAISQAVGAMRALLAMTTDYIKVRRQFGKPLAANQVVQHRAAEMFVATELARSAALYASQAMSEPAPNRRHMIAQAKTVVDRYGLEVGRTAVQLHGAMGLVAEYPVGHFYLRLLTLRQMWGEASWDVSAAL